MINIIKEGSTGEDVKRIGESFGFKNKLVCDKELVWCIKVFQKSVGIEPDGIFGFESWKRLYEKTKKGNQEITKQDYIEFGKLLDCEPEILEAIVKTETNGIGITESGDPTLDFNGEKFKQIYPNSQCNNFEEASKISLNDAIKSSSWGIMLIPGDKFELCSVKTIEDFIVKIKGGNFNQLSLGISYLKNSGICKYLRTLDIKKISFALNGPNFIRNLYDIRLKRHYYSIKRANYPKK